MAYPANYRYTNQHEWIDVKGDTGTIGITIVIAATMIAIATITTSRNNFQIHLAN